MARILLIDDDDGFSPALVEALEEHGHRVRWLDGAEAALPLMAGPDRANFDVVLLDNCMPRMRGLELLELLRRQDIHLPVLLFTSQGTADVAIRASKLGAFRYLPKPDGLGAELAHLLGLIREAAEVAHLIRAPVPPSDADALLDSPCMRTIYEQIGLAARHTGPVLITGEPGTGKERVARALFQHSEREGPFLVAHCGAFEDGRLEEELFGYESGTYPGVDGKAGLIEQANGGGVLLDHFPPTGRALQARLVRLILEGVVHRAGRTARPRRVEVRLLACTSADLGAAVATGLLDPELYFLLADTTIHLPPLRERGDDVLTLAEHFLHQAAARLQRPVRSFHRLARERLRRYPWPGNVRELQAVVRQAVLACRGLEVGPDDLRLGPPPTTRPASEAPDLSEGSLPPSRERAYRLFQWAIEQEPDLAGCTDAEVFRWLQRDVRIDGEGLPARRETFERYLREARAHYQEQKNTPRAGRALGRSIVRADAI